MKIKKTAYSGGTGNAAKAGLWYTVGNFCIKGISFISIPIFSRLLSQADYGLYNTFLAYASILMILLCGMLHASLNNAKYDFPGQLDAYTSSIVLLILFASAAAAVLAAGVSPFLGGVAVLGGGMLVLLVLESLGNALMTFYNTRLSIDFRYREYLGLALFYSLSSILLSVALIYLMPGRGYLARALGSILPLMLIAVYILIRLFRTARPKTEKTYWRYGLKFSLPLIPHGFSQVLLSQFDRIMIQIMIGEAQAGVYSFSYNVGMVYQVISSSLDTAWTPWFYNQMNAGNEHNIRKKTSLYIVMMSLIAVLLLLISPELIYILGGEKYWESRFCVVPIVLGMFFSFLYLLPVAVEYYHRKTKLIAAATICAALLNIVLNAIFIPLYGYVAAAYTTVACYFLYFLFHLIIARKIQGRFLFDMKVMLLCIAGVMTAAFGCLALMDAAAARLALFGVLIAACAAGAVVKRRELRPLLEKIFQRS